MFEPNFWPDLGFWGGVGGMMTAAKPVVVQPPPDDGWIIKFLKGLHVSATITLVIFFWNLYDTSKAKELVQHDEIVSLKAQVQYLSARQNPEVTDAVQTQRLNDFETRLNVQRSDIAELQKWQAQHNQHDNDRFKGINR